MKHYHIWIILACLTILLTGCSNKVYKIKKSDEVREEIYNKGIELFVLNEFYYEKGKEIPENLDSETEQFFAEYVNEDEIITSAEDNVLSAVGLVWRSTATYNDNLERKALHYEGLEKIQRVYDQNIINDWRTKVKTHPLVLNPNNTENPDINNDSINTTNVSKGNYVPELEIVDKKGELNGDYIYVTGAVKNNSGSPFTYIEVKVTYTDDNGTILDTDWTYVNSSDALLPNERKSFKVMTEMVGQKYTKYRVEVADYDIGY